MDGRASLTSAEKDAFGSEALRAPTFPHDDDS